MTHMLDVRDFQAQDLRGLSPEALAEAAEQMLRHIGEQAEHIARPLSQTSCRFPDLHRSATP